MCNYVRYTEPMYRVDCCSEKPNADIATHHCAMKSRKTALYVQHQSELDKLGAADRATAGERPLVLSRPRSPCY